MFLLRLSEAEMATHYIHVGTTRLSICLYAIVQESLAEPSLQIVAN